MGLETNTGRVVYLNIKEGKIVYKDENKETKTSDAISGIIIKVDYVDEEYQGRMYNKAKITIVDGESRFLLQMNTDSGYFRGFCNSLKSGEPTKKVRIAPHYQEKDGKKQSTCFVEQNGKTLKHFFTKENPGDLPQVEKVTFKGKEEWDGTKQINYWKNWLSSNKWENDLVASHDSAATQTQTPEKTSTSIIDAPDYDNDLPF